MSLDCSLPGSSVRGILQARILEWVATPSGDLPYPGIKPMSLTSPTLAGRFFTTSDTWEALRHTSVQFSSVAQLYPTLCDFMNCSMSGLPVHHQLPEFTQTQSIESVMPSNHLILCHPLLLPPSIFPSIRVFSSESILHIRWSKYQTFSFSISPSNEYSGLVSFRIDWLDLLAVQGTLKSLLNTTVQKYQFFDTQLSL